MYKQQNKNTNKPETKNIHWSRRDRKTRKREVTRQVKLTLKSTVVIETKKKKKTLWFKIELMALCCENSKEVKEKDYEKQNRNFLCCFHGWLSVHVTATPNPYLKQTKHMVPLSSYV